MFKVLLTTVTFDSRDAMVRHGQVIFVGAEAEAEAIASAINAETAEFGGYDEAEVIVPAAIAAARHAEEAAAAAALVPDLEVLF